MKAIVTKSFVGRRDDHGESETFSIGDVIEGELAEVAVREGDAEQDAEPEPVSEPEPEPVKKGRK